MEADYPSLVKATFIAILVGPYGLTILFRYPWTRYWLVLTPAIRMIVASAILQLMAIGALS